MGEVPNMAAISRALARHEPEIVYTLLREHYDHGVAGRALQALIATVPDWPKPDREMTKYDQRLTARELQVLRLAEKGMGELETAREIPISYETVKTYRQRIYLKLGVRNVQEAIHMGRELGLIS
jgi:DNA-binding CsgD family transcriptional regulator